MSDWQKKAREMGAKFAQEAAKEGGSTVDVLSAMVVRMHMYQAAEIERLESRDRGRLVPVSMDAIADQLSELVPATLTALAERLCVESLGEIESLDAKISDELDRVTLTMRAKGHVATDTFALLQPVAH